MMVYFKVLSFDVTEVSRELATFCKDNESEFLRKPNIKWHNVDLKRLSDACPSLIPTFKKQGFTLRYVAFIISFAHKDNIHVDDVKETYRINIPVLNVDNTKTIFYKSKSESKKITRPDGLAHYKFDESQCEEVCSVTVDRPVILNVKEPHGVYVYHENFPRITATIAVHEDLALWLN